MRMSGKNINLGDKIIKKSYLYKNKKVTKIDDIDVNEILISKEDPYGTILSNTLLDTMIMMLLDHYA